MLTEKELEEIRRKLLELEDEPPADGWQPIRARINPRRRWRRFWWLLPLALLLTTGGGWLLMNVVTREQPVATWPPAPATHPRAKNRSEAPGPAAPGSAVQVGPVRDDLGRSLSTDPGKALSATGKALPADPDSALPAEPGETSPVAPPLPAEAVAGNRPPSSTGSTPVPPSIGGADQSDRLSGTKPGAPVQRRRPSVSRPGDRQYRPQPAPAGQARIARTTKRQPGDGPSVVPGPAKSGAVKPADGETDAVLSNPGPAVGRLATLAPLRGRPIAPGAWRVAGRQFLLNVPTVSPADSARREPGEEKIRAREPEKSRAWTVGAFAAPRYSFRRFAPEGSDDVYITRLHNRNASNTQRMGYETGLSLGRSVSRRLVLRTSLAYTQLNENLSYAYTTGRVDTVLRSLTGDGKILVTPVLKTGERQLVSSYAYAGWRAGATWYFAQRGRRRYHLSLDGGINLLVKGRTKTLLNGEQQETMSFPSPDNLLEQTNYNLQAGVGCSFRARRGYEFTVMPALNYFLGSTFRSREPFGLRPYSLGVHLQLSRWVGKEQ